MPAIEEPIVDEVFGSNRSVLVPVDVAKSINIISNLQLQISLQAERTNILRYDYSTLRQILSTVESPTINQLALISDTIKKHLRSVLRSIPIRKIKVLLILAKLDTITRSRRDINKKVLEEDLYFLDIRDIFCRLLLLEVSSTIHQGIARLVNVLSKLYESRVQALSIRTTSSEFVYYPNSDATTTTIVAAPLPSYSPYQARASSKFVSTPSSLIFPSDIVRFYCNSTGCKACRQVRAPLLVYIGQVLKVGRNYREKRQEFDY